MSNLIKSEIALLQKRLVELEEMNTKLVENQKNITKKSIADLQAIQKKFEEEAQNPEIDYEAFLPDEHDYERMQSIHDHYDEMTFDEFISWNIECIQKQTKEEEAWLNTLCERLSRHRMKTMDLESCTEFVATGFYFDQHARLIIYNPR